MPDCLISKIVLIIVAFCLMLPASAQIQPRPAKAGVSKPHVQVRSNSAHAADNPKVAVYLNTLTAKLLKNWLVPDGNNHVTITADLETDGKEMNIQAGSSPKNETAEKAALDCFNKCSPFEPLPSGVPLGKLAVHFDSTADPHGDSRSHITARFDPATTTNGVKPTTETKKPVEDKPADKP